MPHPTETSRCTAHKKTGQRCGQRAILGTNVCRVHGGAAPQVREKARQRLLAAADQVAADLVAIARDRKQPGSVRVAACKSILDRAGVPEVRREEVTGADGAAVQMDYARLSEAQWAELERLARLAIVGAASPMLDVEPEPVELLEGAGEDEDGEKLT